MGRYYNGDINGKFWFAVQPSDAADRFGVSGYKPEYLQYYFDKENIKDIKEELKSIETFLGENLKKLDDFFDKNDTYNTNMLIEYLGLNEDSQEDVKKMISEYADYELGKEILECINENESCEFEAEC